MKRILSMVAGIVLCLFILNGCSILLPRRAGESREKVQSQKPVPPRPGKTAPPELKEPKAGESPTPSPSAQANAEDDAKAQDTSSDYSQDTPSSATLQEVDIDKESWKKLNTFFSNFSEAFVPPFEKGKLSDEELISFGIIHNIINNPKRFSEQEQYRILDKKYVDESVMKYFGLKVGVHQSVNCDEYKDGSYRIPQADGEAICFSQVVKFYDMGNGYYKAEVNIFTASSGFTRDFHATPEEWEAEGEEVTLTGKMTATVKKLSDRYILIDYLKAQ